MSVRLGRIFGVPQTKAAEPCEQPSTHPFEGRVFASPASAARRAGCFLTSLTGSSQTPLRSFEGWCQGGFFASTSTMNCLGYLLLTSNDRMNCGPNNCMCSNLVCSTPLPLYLNKSSNKRSEPHWQPRTRAKPVMDFVVSG